jgi:hypothetical protein
VCVERRHVAQLSVPLEKTKLSSDCGSGGVGGEGGVWVRWYACACVCVCVWEGGGGGGRMCDPTAKPKQRHRC